MIHLKTFTFNPFQENTSVLYQEEGEAIIVDPGCYEPSEEKRLKAFVEEKELEVKAIYNTHCHIDHVLGVNFCKTAFGVPFFIHKEDEPWLRAVPTYAPNYGFERFRAIEADGYYGERDTIIIGNEALRVLHVPGHCPGHTALIYDEGRWVVGGDILFQGSIGRTDLPGGDFDTLIRAIREKLFSLPEDYRVYPGHGPSTTIGEEKKHNPFCALA